MAKAEKIHQLISGDCGLAIVAEKIGRVMEEVFNYDIDEGIKKLEDEEQRRVCHITYEPTHKRSSGKDIYKSLYYELLDMLKAKAN